jgi:putative membrane protein
MLIVGIGYHVAFMLGLRQMREAMKADGLVHAESHFPVSLTLTVALLLLAIGFAAIISMVFHAGPFG